ncbi:hypothetical protein E5288_WYG007487 [Bos mutus]|uniref:Uncharacterized protein n=1 Tax=Bos mutus TaxID=72004 RepID=A0A6B0RAS8_9CETA|nr:hypothetical protein [Bos mutus]
MWASGSGQWNTAARNTTEVSLCISGPSGYKPPHNGNPEVVGDLNYFLSLILLTRLHYEETAVAFLFASSKGNTPQRLPPTTAVMPVGNKYQGFASAVSVERCYDIRLATDEETLSEEYKTKLQLIQNIQS